MIFNNLKIVPIILEDLTENHPLYLDWGKYVLGIVGNVDLVVTGNRSVGEDFIKHNIPLLWLPRYNGISGTKIRRKILQRDENWKDLVTEESSKIIERSNFYKKYFNRS